MRGKAAGTERKAKAIGITPAYAGKRAKKSATQSAEQDHPRLCGEKLGYVEVLEGNLGSPPPMRGKADLPIMANVAKGITPAYAGKRCSE